MRLLKTLVSLVVNLHIYVAVLATIFLLPQSPNAVYGYLAFFLFTTYFTFLPLLVFRAGLNFKDGYIIWLLYLGVAALLVDFFYLQGRTDLFWLGIYTAIFTTGRVLWGLYHHPSIDNDTSVSSHIARYIVVLPILALLWAVWFEFTDRTHEIAFVTFLLVVYAVMSVCIEGFFILREKKYIGYEKFDGFLVVVFFVGALFLAMTSLVLVESAR